MEIKAAIAREKGHFSVETAELEQPNDNEVLVKITACGMCHTDLAMLNQSAPFSLPLPALLGHEGAGVVERVGKNATNLAVGDKVVMSFAFCGECDSCRAG
ncbi:MAG: alcohol dehydrogenase catalytic domain-containing protein [Pseudomonadales bacterium]